MWSMILKVRDFWIRTEPMVSMKQSRISPSKDMMVLNHMYRNGQFVVYHSEGHMLLNHGEYKPSRKCPFMDKTILRMINNPGGQRLLN